MRYYGGIEWACYHVRLLKCVNAIACYQHGHRAVCLLPTGSSLSEAVIIWQGEHIAGVMMQARKYTDHLAAPYVVPAFLAIERAMGRSESGDKCVLFHATTLGTAEEFITKYNNIWWLATSTTNKAVLPITGAKKRKVLRLIVPPSVKRLVIAGSGLGDPLKECEGEVLLAAGLELQVTPDGMGTCIAVTQK